MLGMMWPPVFYLGNRAWLIEASQQEVHASQGALTAPKAKCTLMELHS